jgi:predicted RNA-binding protein with PUA-like domain
VVAEEEVNDVEEEEEATVEPPKKRGRPARVPEEVVEPPKKRGRPAKTAAAATAPEPAKKRGRPARINSEVAAEEEDEVEEAEDDTAKTEQAKKRGRPAKKQAAPAPAKQTAVTQSAKKRGRPAKATTDPAEHPAEPDTPAPRKRHSGRTGGPTTKISTDAEDAADQLEDELIDEVQKSVKKGAKGKPASSAFKKQDVNEDGKNYWLMKAEQVDRMETLKDGTEFNTKFTIDDLKARGAPEPWEGVRNFVARNHMRAMKQGDLAFFYASQGKAPGITGIIEFVQEHEPDFTVTDESSIGYVEPAKRGQENQWSLVHVGFLQKLSKPVTLKELQKYSGGNGILQDMQVIKQSRLSVTKVSEKEWNFIVNELIEGYEEDGANDEDDDDDDGLVGVKVGGGAPLNPDLSGGQAMAIGDAFSPSPSVVQATAGAKMEESEDVLPGLPAAQAVNGADDSDELLMSGAVLPSFTSATARPTSQHSSRPASRAGYQDAASRQQSLAPPVLQTTEAVMEVTMTETDLVEPDVAEPVRAVSRNGSVKPGVSSRASSRAPSVARSRAASRAPSVPRSRASSRAPSLAPSLRSVDRGNSLEPSARPGSRGNLNLMPSLMESSVDAEAEIVY